MRVCHKSVTHPFLFFFPFHRYEIFKKHFYLQQSPNFHKLGLCFSAKKYIFAENFLKYGKDTNKI